MKVALFGAGILFAITVRCAEPAVSNRSPAPDEIGYRPTGRAEMNPPSFTWLREKEAATYFVQWSQRADFRDAVTASNLIFNTYTHNKPLDPGTYFWRYGFETGDGSESSWSTVREFEVTTNSIRFPLPSKRERLELIPGRHPRLFVRPETLGRAREAASTFAKADFAVLKKQADKLLGAKLVPEPRNPGTASNKTNVTLLKNWWANREQALQACTEAETIAFVFLITEEPKYGAEARRRLLDLAAWDPSGETNFKRNCEAAKPLLHRIARVYDWCYPALTDSDRLLVRQSVKRRIEDAWVSGEVGRGVGGINNPRNSHGNRTFHKIGESGIVFLGEIPEAELWLDYALNRFYACYPAWSDSDGGWHEGLSYWAGYMSKIVWWLEAMDVALGIDGFKKPFFSHSGDFALYVAPPRSPTMGFGDLSYRPPSSGWACLDYLVRGAMRSSVRASGKASGDSQKISNAPYWQWWSEQWNMSDGTGVFGFLYKARLPELPRPQPPTALPSSRVFEGTGIASLHTTLVDSKEDVHLLFKSSPFGSVSHGFNAQNAIQLNAYGECLLPACTYRDWYGTGFHYKWVHETVSQNAVLVNGKGQITHSPLPARITGQRLMPGWDYVQGDASAAYGKAVSRAIRHVLFVKPSAIILVDELETVQPSTFQFMLHGLSPFEMDEKSQALLLQRPAAGLVVRYLPEEPLALRQWDGFEPKPMRGDFPNHWHVEASTTSRNHICANVTVLLPYKDATPPDIVTRRRDTKEAYVIELESRDTRTLAIIRKPDVSGEIEVDGQRMSGPVAVRRGAIPELRGSKQ